MADVDPTTMDAAALDAEITAISAERDALFERALALSAERDKRHAVARAQEVLRKLGPDGAAELVRHAQSVTVEAVSNASEAGI